MHRITVLPITFILLSLSSIYSFTFMGTEDSLRNNIQSLFAGQLQFSDESIPSYQEELLDSTPEDGTEYDFIVIGAGSAGTTIASRLSEVKNISVLLLEAGGKEYPIMDIPYSLLSLQNSPTINWDYYTEPSNTYCLGMVNSSCKVPRGKVMGGSSVLNYMIATRGNKRDFDQWAQMTKDKSWSYREFLKYFKKLEDFEVNGIENKKYHSKNGPMHITGYSFHTPLADAFIAASKEMGYPENDYNGKEQVGCSLLQNTIKNSERWSTNRAYLHPAKNRANLFLSRNSHVNKILIDTETKNAYGVSFTKLNKTIMVKAAKEIILSAGAYNSPQILMLSGIGPAKHLRDLGIDIIKDAPVGEHLMDHPVFPGLTFKVNDSQTYKEVNALDPTNPAVRDYITSRTGLLTLTGVEALSYINVDTLNPVDKRPNVELLFGSFSGLVDPYMSNLLGIDEKFRSKMIADKFNHSSWIIWPMLMRPKSRGKLLLRNKNPTTKPIIIPNYLDNPDDLRVLVKSIRFIIELSRTTAFQKYNSTLYDMPLPCENLKKYSDAYWECAVRTYTSTIYHPTSTCKMGTEYDPTSVVNSRLKVIGIKGLRVGDASIMPVITSAHPNLPTVAIGEKLADMIKSDWQLK